MHQGKRWAGVLWTAALCATASFSAQAQSTQPVQPAHQPAHQHVDWRASSQEERAADAAAFAPVSQALAVTYTDVQSVVVVLRGRVVYEYYRDGAPDRLRDQYSVSKSALSALVGIALGQGRLASLDDPVVKLVPEWASLNADPRAKDITVRHLLTMTAGFDIDDPSGTARSLPVPTAWARPLGARPGEKFAYDNSVIPLLSAVIEKVTGMRLADYARENLVGPLGLQEPSYERGLHMRTIDAARLGQLFLRNGAWNGQQVLPASYVADATSARNRGGRPVSMPYGYLWWIVPSNGADRNFMASGWGGQMIWVHGPMELVVAVNSTATPQSQQRGHAVQLLRSQILPAVARAPRPS